MVDFRIYSATNILLKLKTMKNMLTAQEAKELTKKHSNIKEEKRKIFLINIINDIRAAASTGENKIEIQVFEFRSCIEELEKLGYKVSHLIYDEYIISW